MFVGVQMTSLGGHAEHGARRVLRCARPHQRQPCAQHVPERRPAPQAEPAAARHRPHLLPRRATSACAARGSEQGAAPVSGTRQSGARGKHLCINRSLIERAILGLDLLGLAPTARRQVLPATTHFLFTHTFGAAPLPAIEYPRNGSWGPRVIASCIYIFDSRLSVFLGLKYSK
jgi:hypothetical protein